MLIAFPLQLLLHRRTSKLRYAHIACLVCKCCTAMLSLSSPTEVLNVTFPVAGFSEL